MTVQASRYTASGDLSVYAGEALAIELVILRDGVPIDPTGREGALTLWRTTNLEPILPAIAGVIVDRVHSKHGPIKVPRYVLPGTASRLIFDKHRTGTGYQIASANRDGLDFQLVGKVTTRPTADLDAAQGDGEPPVVQVTVETRVQTIVVDMRGPPGLSPWEALGITQAEYEASVRQPAEDAAAEAIAATAALVSGQERALMLADLLIPSGATLLLADPANAVLVGDMM